MTEICANSRSKKENEKKYKNSALEKSESISQSNKELGDLLAVLRVRKDDNDNSYFHYLCEVSNVAGSVTEGDILDEYYKLCDEIC